MSPAMVDFRSPLQNPNPKKGQSSSSPFLFNPTQSFNISNQSPLPPQIQNLAMNSNDGSSRNFNKNVNPPSFPSLSPAAAASSSSVPGLSRPRFLKVRRHFGSLRGGKPSPSPSASSAASASINETLSDTGFNPFRSSVPISRDSDRNDDGKMPERESRVDSGKMQSNVSQVDSDFNPFRMNQNKDDKIPTKESMVNSDFNPFQQSSSVVDGANRTDNGEMRGERDQLYSWNPFSSHEIRDRDGSSGSNSEKFEFGKSCDLDLKNSLPDVMGKLKIGSVKESRSKNDANFNFTAEGKASSNLKSGEASEKGVFVFGSRGSKSLSPAPNSMDDSSASTLLGETRKSKVVSGMTSQDINNAGFSFSAGGRANTTNLNSGEVPDAGLFVFGRGGKKSSDSAPNLPDESSGSKLPDEMRKLKIGSGMTSQDANNEGFTYTAEGKVTTNLGLNSSEVHDAAVFVLGRGGNRSSDSQPNLADESSMSKLPDEMGKLNIEGSRKDKVCEKAEDADEKFGFVFGAGSKNVTDSFGESAGTTLPAEMKKLNIESQSGHNVRTDTSFSSSTAYAKGTQFQNPANRNFTGASIPPPFTFQAGMQGNSSVVQPALPTQLKEDFRSSGISAPSSSSSSMGPGFHSDSNIFEQPFSGPTVNKSEFSFTSTREAFGTPHMDFRTPRQDASWSYRDSLFGGSCQNVEFSAKRGTFKETKSKSKTKRGKLGRKNLISVEKSSQENSELGSPGRYSPMDFSPYQETLTPDQCSRETSVASGESIPLESTSAQESVPMDVRDEDLLAATQRLHINEVNLKHGESNEEGSKYFVEGSLSTEGLASDNEKAGFKNDSNIAAMGMEAGLFGFSVERQGSDGGMIFEFASSSEGVGETNFTFAATPSQGPLSAAKRHYRKKNWVKATQDSYASTPNSEVQSASPSVQFMPLASCSLQQGLSQGQIFSSSSPQLETRRGQKGDLFVSQNEAVKEPVVRQDPMSTAAVAPTAQEACEKWRQRGNQAYANGNPSKAEDHYTRGVNCVSPKETSRSCVRALMLCYSNRAATRMSLGRIKEALGDCMMAAAIEPNFLRAQVRAANCYLALGETEDALKHFKKCLQTGCDVSLDQKIRTEASDGLQKAQQVAEYMDRSAELLQNRTYNNAANALEIITEALLISPYSENLVEMKAEALLMLRKYEEVVQLCEQTLESAERNSFSNSADGKSEDVDGSESMKPSPVNLWRWRLISKSYFYLGKLEESLELLQKHEQVGPNNEKYGSKVLESSTGFALTMRDLLRHKASGNEAFQAGRHAEAVEHYTAALQCNVESPPFAAICFANRAAAYQALGQITDAIADCSLAIALDSNYPKAISRRATLHEMIRDYGQAISDLQRLISLLEKQADDKTSQLGTLGRSTGSINDLRQARIRLSTMEEEAKQGIPLDMYLILGTEPSSTAVDIKKAYRKAALRHHPDKAGQFLPRSENGDDGLWKEVADEIHKDADRLFKMIGEAYAVISDPTKRLRYDAEEEMRNAQKKGNGSSTPKPQGDVHSYPFEQSSNRRSWRDPWKSYGHQRWSESSRSNRYS